MTQFFASLFGAFAFGSVFFWLLSAAWICFMFWTIETENSVGSGVWFIVYMLFLQFIVKADFFHYTLQHPLLALGYVVGYIVIGFVWSFIKWWLYVSKKWEKDNKSLLGRRKQFLENARAREKCSGPDYLSMFPDKITEDTPVPAGLRAEWREEMKFYIPHAKDKKGLITLWVMYWPLSGFWSLINDFVKKLIRAIVTKLQTVYDAITSSVVNGLK